ncbi:MAG: hypothetical protein AB7Q42_09955 [Acidimicrobiia bacterium]
MFADVGDRRRLALATVLTIVAMPFLWSSKDTSSPGTQLAVTAASAQPEINTPFEAAAVPDPAFLTGPALSLPDVITIDVASAPIGNLLSGKASYRNWPEGLANGEGRPCGTSLVPFGSRIVVTNTDNGKKIACVNVTTRPNTGDIAIVIDTATFVELADLTDAPLSVDLSW